MFSNSLHIRTKRNAMRLSYSWRASTSIRSIAVVSGIHSNINSQQLKEGDKQLLLSVLQNLDASLRVPGVANADKILEDFKVLNRLGRIVPISYYIDAARVFTERRDVVRAELLIHICRENLSVQSTHADKAIEKSFQSHPNYDPLNKLISFSISGLFRYGCTEEASKMWVRMTNLGYVTNRVGMEKMLDRIVGGSDSVPSLEFIDSLHNAMRAHHWNQSSRYYSRLMKVYYHYLLSKSSSPSSITSHKDLQLVIRRLDQIWDEARDTLLLPKAALSDDNKLLPSPVDLPLELHALRIHCFVAVMITGSRQPLLRDSHLSASTSYKERALAAFRDFISLSASSSDGYNDARVLDAIKDEILLITNDLTANGNTMDSSQRRAAAVMNAGDEIGSSSSGSGGGGSSSSSNSSSSSHSVQAHNSLRHALGNSRKAIGLLLTTLAKQGHSHEAISLLKYYLQEHSSSISDSSASSSSSSSATSSASYVSPSLARSSPIMMFDLKQQLSALSTHSTSAADRSLLMESKSKSDIENSFIETSNAALQYELPETRSGIVARRLMSQLLHDADAAGNDSQCIAIDDDKTWQSALVCDILRSCNVAMTPAPNSNGDVRVLRDLKEILSTLEGVVFAHQLKPGAQFMASFIDAISSNMKHLESQGKIANELHWTTALPFINTIIDGTEDKVGRSPEVYHAIINLLCCSSANPEVEAVVKAITIVQQMNREKVPVSPASLCIILDTATTCLDDTHLHQVLQQIENVFAHPVVIKQLSPEMECVVLRSRIFAHARLRQGFKSLILLRRMRKIGGKAELRLYRWIINALHQASPCSDAEWVVAKHPSHTIDFLLREMVRDGHRLDSNIIALILRLYTKSVQIHVSQGGYKQALSSMEEFIERCSTAGFMSNPPIPINDLILKELIKAYCIAGMEKKASQIIDTAPKKYNVKETATLYEPLLFYLAGLKGLIYGAQDLLMQMINRRIPLTDAIIVPLVLGYMRQRSLSEALDCIQDLFNQHRVRPTISLWLLLIDGSLKTGDYMEARRVVSFISQMYTIEERELLIGPMLRTKPDAEHAKEYFEGKGKKIESKSNKSDNQLLSTVDLRTNGESNIIVSGIKLPIIDDNVIDKVSLSNSFDKSEDDETVAERNNRLAILSYWYPTAVGGTTERIDRYDRYDSKPDNTGENGDSNISSSSDYHDDDDIMSAYKRYLPSHGYLLKLGVPYGQKQRGVLSDRMLKKRFQHYGYTLL